MEILFNEKAQKYSKYLLQKDEETDFRIKTGIEMYRKGFARFELKNADGTPVKKATVKVKQRTHQFLFGCNAFMQGQFPAEAQNQQYEETFAGIFNEAVIPFYWSDFEREDGQTRFAHGAQPDIYRRPPTDDVLAFCRKYGITPKGHPLCWKCFIPDWTPQNFTGMMRRLDRRLQEIAEHYGKEIFIWDCVNEAQTIDPLTRDDHVPLPPDHVEKVFKMADRYFANAQLLYNDDRIWWNLQGDYSPVYLLASRLQEHGCRLGGLGLQFHLFQDLLETQSHLFLNPRILYAALDQYAKLGVPLNLSEVSIVSRRDFGDGDLFQKKVTERLYKIWFSHPAVEGITWWNLVDGTAAYAPLGSEQGENSLRAGLVNYDFTLKPAYHVLDHLIHHEWRTETQFEYEDGGDNQFHGFYGLYDAEITTDQGTFHLELDLNKNSYNRFIFSMHSEKGPAGKNKIRFCHSASPLRATTGRKA